MTASAVLFKMRRLVSQWLKHEHDRELHTLAVTVKTGTYSLLVPRLNNPSGGYETSTVSTKEVPTGTVMGKATVGAATSAAKTGGNTGGGSLTLDVTTPVLAGAKAGVYTVRCVGVVANAGLFAVTDPDGVVLGNYAIGGAAFANQIKFAMADSGTDFALGDGFDITVAAGSGKYLPCALDAVDGSATPAGILFDGVDTTDGDASGVVVDGFARVNPLELVWTDTFDTSGKRNAALAKLAAQQIKTVAVV